MENLHQSKFQQIFYEYETGIMYNTWLSDSFTMKPNDYKFELTKLVQLIATHSATKQWINTREVKVTIEVELQEWTDEKVSKKNKNVGIKKAAFVIAQEIFSQISIEQAMEEREGKEMSVQYFTNQGKAREWLMED